MFRNPGGVTSVDIQRQCGYEILKALGTYLGARETLGMRMRQGSTVLRNGLGDDG
jgi:hypothetical protein